MIILRNFVLLPVVLIARLLGTVVGFIDTHGIALTLWFCAVFVFLMGSCVAPFTLDASSPLWEQILVGLWVLGAVILAPIITGFKTK